MKKVFLMIAAALISMSAMAQVQFGAKVGFDMTNFWGENVQHKMKPGYQVGVLMEAKLADRFAIAPEVVFAAQGGKSELFGDFDLLGIHVDGKDATYTTNYVNVPVMLKFYATPNFSIDLGPQVGFNVYSKYSVEDVDDAVDMKDHTKTVDFGVGLGATYSLTENAFVQARYTMGLTKAFENGEAKNGNIQVAFGWKF
jgi:hypothetical protein